MSLVWDTLGTVLGSELCRDCVKKNGDQCMIDIYVQQEATIKDNETMVMKERSRK